MLHKEQDSLFLFLLSKSKFCRLGHLSIPSYVVLFILNCNEGQTEEGIRSDRRFSIHFLGDVAQERGTVVRLAQHKPGCEGCLSLPLLHACFGLLPSHWCCSKGTLHSCATTSVTCLSQGCREVLRLPQTQRALCRVATSLHVHGSFLVPYVPQDKGRSRSLLVCYPG